MIRVWGAETVCAHWEERKYRKKRMGCKTGLGRRDSATAEQLDSS